MKTTFINSNYLGNLALGFEQFYASRKVFFHILFWVLLLLIYLIETIFIDPSFSISLSFVFTFRGIIQSIFAFYFISYLVIPGLLFKRKYLLGLIGLSIPFAVAPSINYLVFLIASKIFTHDEMFKGFVEFSMFLQSPNHLFSFHNISLSFMGVALRTMPAFIVKLLMSIIRYFQKTNRLQKREYQLEKENLQLEINFLKSQMNPHFLFNTLNNIYAYVALSDTKALDLITNLSEMLQYTLYDTKDSMVPLKNELKFLENYIELERARYNEKNCIIEYDFDYNGTGHIEIAPLLLFPFVENAFKHGIAKNKKAGRLNAIARIEEDVLIFHIENNKPLPGNTGMMEKLVYKTNVGGIGVSNTQRRLSVLYKQKHELLITETKEKYTVLLKINCKKNEPEPEMYDR